MGRIMMKKMEGKSREKWKIEIQNDGKHDN
jgi:hypothetical protein